MAEKQQFKLDDQVRFQYGGELVTGTVVGVRYKEAKTNVRTDYQYIVGFVFDDGTGETEHSMDFTAEQLTGV